jgi:hypothetical protein
MKATRSADWLAAADVLAGILQAENDALRMTDFAAATSLLPAKRAAIEAIDVLTPSGPKAALAETASRLDHLAAENRKLLNRSIAIQSQVLGIIAGAARSAAVFGYGSSGKSAARNGAFTLSAKA